MRIRRSIRLLALGLALLAAASTARAQWTSPGSGDRRLVIEVLDIGQGDSILIRSPEGKTALIDAGPTKRGALDLLRRMGITHLDLVAISHHHNDHYGGMGEVVRVLHPRYFLASHSGHSTRTYLNLLRTVEAQSITAIQPTSRPRRIELGTVELTIFPQPPEDPGNENNNSIGLRLKYGSFSMLLTGDSEVPERRWWEQHDPSLVRDCTILKLPHHGSRNGTDERWLELVRPELAVASMGRNNEFGHPHPETLRLLSRDRIPLLRTDQLGTIALESDGRTWSVIRPAMARRGRPTQADIDRIATVTRDDDVERSPRRSRAR